MVLLKFTAFAVIFLAFTIESGDAVCCSKKRNGKCSDCTTPTPCCGRGKCNVFCCNCDDGCRFGSCQRRRSVVDEMLLGNAPAETSGGRLVALADRNGDGRLSFDEAHEFLDVHHGVVDHRRRRAERDLSALDVDGDSFLTAEEIDPEL